MDTIGSGTYGRVQIIDGFVTKKMTSSHIFLREVIILRYLNMIEEANKFVPTLLSTTPTDNSFTMQKYPVDLEVYLYSYNPSKSDRAALILPLIQSLYYLHANGILHGDLKPSNIMIHEGNVIIIDYGLSGTLRSNYADLCTPAYRIDKSTKNFSCDIFSLGIVLCEIMVGKYEKNLKKLVNTVDETFRPILKNMLSKKETHRPTIYQIACHFNVPVPPLISRPDFPSVKVDESILDWIQTVLFQFNVKNDKITQDIASLAETFVKSKKNIQYFIMAIILLYLNMNIAETSLLSVLTFCPLWDEGKKRRVKLLEILKKVLENSTIIYYIIHE